MGSEAGFQPAQEFLKGKKWMPLESFYTRYIVSPAERIIRSAALLEYPQEYLDLILEKTVDHHYGNWDEIYKSVGRLQPEYDLWLDKYVDILKESKDIPIIDLGCGYGNDTLYLHEKGYTVISCDLSGEALKRLDHFIDKPIIRQFDMLTGLPFDNDSARIIIADLSIHYFLLKDTEKLVEEIKRVLTGGGHLLCRMNSTEIMRRDAGDGVKIEENYYDLGGRKKRFFDRNQLERLFKTWDMCHIDEYSLDRFGSAKILWEIAVRKPVN